MLYYDYYQWRKPKPEALPMTAPQVSTSDPLPAQVLTK